MRMKNEDLKLAEKATELNRERFIEQLAYHNGDAIARKLRVSIGIPPEGFETAQEAGRWLRPSDMPTADVARRHLELSCATRVMLEKLCLSQNFYSAMRYFLVLNTIRHIPGNFSVTITAGSKRLVLTEDAPLATGEKRLLDKLKKEIHKTMGNKNRRGRKNAKHDAEALRLHHQKGVINGIDSETGQPTAMIKTDRDIVGRLDVGDELPTKTKENAEINKLKLARNRAKKRSR